MKRKFTDEDYTKHFKRSTFFSENKVDNIVGWPPSNNRYENHSEAFFKSRNGYLSLSDFLIDVNSNRITKGGWRREKVNS